jgi:uncharacterized coiled-coil protein SlyX
MADQVQWRGGSRENSDDFTGAPREVTVDTTDWILRVHDGIKPGGHKMMKVNDCLVVQTADKCNPEHPSCQVTVNGQLDINGPVDIEGEVDIEGNINLDGELTVLDKHDTLLTGNLTVEGKTHVRDLNVMGCITNEANPCGLNEPVTVCDDFKVSGDTELADTIIKGNLVVDGNFLQQGGTLAVKTNEVILTNPGAINTRSVKIDCNILPSSPPLMTQEDANQYIDVCLRALENAICDFDLAAIDEIQDIKDDLTKIWTAIAALENRVDQIEIDMAALAARVDLLEQAIALLETEIEALQNQVTENSKAIEALKVLVASLQDQIDDTNASIGDGRITLEDSAGVDIGSFTVNQKGDTTITLPAGFSGDYNDLNNLPEINDGSMTLESESGTVYGSFSANEASNITISIPDPFSGDWADIDNKPTEFPPTDHTHTLNELTDTGIAGESAGQVLTYDSAQKLWINADIPESGLPESDINDLIGQQKLDDHVDVTVPNPKQHDILAWDDRLQMWVAKSPLQPPSAISVKGVINVAQPAPQNPQPGDMYFHHDPNISTGPDDTVQAESTWVGIVGQEVHEGEYVLYSTDNEWHHTGNDMVQLDELQSDWNQNDPSESDYIHNKPDIEAIVDSQAGDGQINVNAGDGLSASGTNATANQTGDTTRTLSVKTGNGISIDGSGNVIIDPAFNLDGNITAPGNGQINVNAGDGLSVSGTNATANQTGNTTRTFTVKTAAGIIIDGGGNVAIDPAFDLDGNVTAPNDGVLTIKDSDGADVGKFTANQAGPTEVILPKGFSGSYNDLTDKPAINNGTLTIKDSTGVSVGSFTANQAGTTDVTLPKGFSGDYNDLSNKPAINNGTLTIKNDDGTSVGSFTANQSGNTNVTLPKGFSGSYNDLSDKPTSFPPSGHTHSYNELTDRPTIPTVNNGALTIKDSGGTTVGSFTANQSGNTNVTLPKGFSGNYNDLTNKPSIGNGQIVIKQGGAEKGKFTMNQTNGGTIELTDTNTQVDAYTKGESNARFMPLDIRTLPALP